MERIEALAAGGLAGIVAGAAAGLVARFAMRLVALGVADAGMQVPIFTLGGTLAIVVSGAVAGAPLGALYALISRRIPGPARWRGLTFGLIALVVTGPVFFGGNDEFFSQGRVVVFVAVFPVFGVALGLLEATARRIAASLVVPLRLALVLVAAGGAALVTSGTVDLAARAVEVLGPAPVLGPAAVATLLVLAARRRRPRAALALGG